MERVGVGNQYGRSGRSIHKERAGEGRSVQKERKEKQMTLGCLIRPLGSIFYILINVRVHYAGRNAKINRLWGSAPPMETSTLF